jgi:GxxExxY protein
MKNQFFGDKRDLFKFHLALHIMESIPQLKTFTYVPMLTPNNESGHGSLTDYPRPPCHADLHQFLQQAVQGDRNIQSLREFFKNRSFRYQPYQDSTYFVQDSRNAYFQDIPAENLRDALILLDPDVGLKAQAQGDRHLRFDDVAGLCGRMNENSILTIFQFLFFPNDPQRIADIQTRLRSALPAAQVAECHQDQVVLFLLAKDNRVFDALQDVVADDRVSQKNPPCGSTELKHKKLTERIIGVFFDVYNELGHGFLESVYQNAMEIALRHAGLKVEREVPIPVLFRGRDVGNFKADLLVEDCVVVGTEDRSSNRSHPRSSSDELPARNPNRGGPAFQFWTEASVQALCL